MDNTENFKSILLAVHVLTGEGSRLFGQNWENVLSSLRSTLQKNGSQCPRSRDDLLLFSYSHPFIALTDIIFILRTLKSDYHKALDNKGLPIQFIIDFYDDTGGLSLKLDSGHDFWSLLTPGKIYVSEPLKTEWKQLMSGRKLPPHSFREVENNLFKLTFSSLNMVESDYLLPCRKLLAQGNQKECFYCGLKNHTAQDCSSRFLSLESNCLGDVGYIPFSRLNSILKTLLASQQKLTKILVDGLTVKQIRKNDALLAVIAYFDINKFYQLRFLSHVAFSSSSDWTAMLKSKRITNRNKNLFLGLDCLRIQNYNLANSYLQEAYLESGTHFYATIGLAFLALEQGREDEMLVRLKEARSIAVQEKERVYIELLLARGYEVSGKLWEATKTIEEVLALKPVHPEIIYRLIQLETKKKREEEIFQQLQKLVTEYKEFFMTALMDPILLPIQDKIEPVLLEHFQQTRSGAQSLLSQAVARLESMVSLLGAEDKSLSPSIESINRLKEKYEHGSYFDYLDVMDTANVEVNILKRIRIEKIDGLQRTLSRAQEKEEKLRQYWEKYSYKSFYKSFPALLSSVQQHLLTAGNLIKVAKDENYRKCSEFIGLADKDFMILDSRLAKMDALQTVITGLIYFLKNLAITALFVNLVVGFMIFSSGSLLSGSGIGEMFSGAGNQRTIWIFANLLVSPFLALCGTIAGIVKSGKK